MQSTMPVSLASLSLCLCVAAATAARGDETPELGHAYSYIAEKMAGRRLELKTTAIIAGGRVEAEFQRIKTISNVARTSNGLTFDFISVISQRNYDLNEAGERLPRPPQTKDRVVAVRYEVRKSLSTGQLVGISRILLNTEQDSVGSAKSLRVQLVNDRLILRTKDMLYADHFAIAGGYNPGVTESTDEYWLADGKLHGKVSSESVVVDPDTLVPVGKPTSNIAEEQEIP